MAKLYTVSQIADLLRVCPSTVRRMIRMKTLGSMKVGLGGKGVRVHSDQLYRYLKDKLAQRKVQEMIEAEKQESSRLRHELRVIHSQGWGQGGSYCSEADQAWLNQQAHKGGSHG